MSGDGLVAAALAQRRRRAAAKARGRWGDGLDGQRPPGFRVVVTGPGRRGRRIKLGSFILTEDDEPDWQRVTGSDYRSEPLPATVAVGSGVSVAAPSLRVVLDALASGGRHRIEVEDLKVILSQLGSRISHVGVLPAAQRRHAERALHTAILSRCTSL